MIYPKPQKIDSIALFTVPAPLIVTVKGDIPNISSLAGYAGIGNLAENGNIVIQVKLDNTRNTTYIEETQSITNEKYALNIVSTGSGADIQLSSAGQRGIFYGLCSIAQMIEANEFFSGEIIDYPLFKTRGYIEGFYGKPWSFDQRCGILKLMAKNKMNTVYYGPKDDDYHRELWRDLYPDSEIAGLEKLFRLSQEAQMDFYYCIAPGLSIKYSDENEFEALMNKTKQLYALGIRRFGLLLDDIPEELKFAEDIEMYGEVVNAHVDLCGRYYQALKNLDSANYLTVCPMQYFGKGNEYFISKFGQGLPAEISIFWTGRDVCSRELTVPEAFTFISSTNHRPLYWDNYPVNDGDMFNEMHLGPIIGRDPDLYHYSEGIISNAMESCECSKIPLITVADYLWNSVKYNPEESYSSAIMQVVGKENAQAFECFADHLRTSCLKDGNSKKLQGLFGAAERLFEAGAIPAAFSTVNEYVDSMNACRDLLKSNELPIYTDLSRWAEKFSIFCDIINQILELLTSYDDEARDEVYELIRRYNADPTILTTFHLKDLFDSMLKLEL